MTGQTQVDLKELLKGDSLYTAGEFQNVSYKEISESGYDQNLYTIQLTYEKKDYLGDWVTYKHQRYILCIGNFSTKNFYLSDNKQYFDKSNVKAILHNKPSAIDQTIKNILKNGGVQFW